MFFITTFALRNFRNETIEMNRNPFITDGYAGKTYFCDRVKESAEIVSGLTNGRNITLMAPRRLGKTGLIKHVMQQIADADKTAVCLYLDLLPTKSIEDFTVLLADTVIGKLDSTAKKAMTRVAKFITSWKPIFTFDSITGMPQVVPSSIPTHNSGTLKEIFDYLASADKRCYIAFDEFQQISYYPEGNAEALLRSFIQFSPNVSYIFSGSKKGLLSEMFSSPKRPFYKSTQLMEIACLEEDTYYNFAKGFMTEAGISFPKEAFSYLYQKFEGTTSNIQFILNRLYEWGEDVDGTLVDKAIDAVVQGYSPYFSDVINRLPRISTNLLKAIAAEGKVPQPTSSAFIARNRLSAASSISSALKRLCEDEYLYKTPSGYMIYDRFFEHWLKSLKY